MDLHSRLRSDLQLSRLSPRTQKHYIQHFRRFCAHFPDRRPEELGEDDVRAYLHHLVDTRKASQYTHKMAVAAIKLLFTQTLGRPDEVARVPWPKVRDRLPTVLTHDALMRLFRAADTPLLRTALLCGYAAGLRVSEACRLQVQNLDSQLLYRGEVPRRPRSPP